MPESLSNGQICMKNNGHQGKLNTYAGCTKSFPEEQHVSRKANFFEAPHSSMKGAQG